MVSSKWTIAIGRVPLIRSFLAVAGIAIALSAVQGPLWEFLQDRDQLNPLYLLARRFIQCIEGSVYMVSLVPTAPTIDNSYFEWADSLQDNWKVIRDELDDILVEVEEVPDFLDISPEQKTIIKRQAWKTYFFAAFGVWIEENGARCPKTWELLKEIPNLKTAFFSILLPGQRISRHRGAYNGVLRYHLGLKVPQPSNQCSLELNNELIHWEEGIGFAFDDTYYHEAWNDSDEIRVILLLDILRPLRFPFSTMNNFFVNTIGRTPFVQNARTALLQWNEAQKQNKENQ